MWSNDRPTTPGFYWCHQRGKTRIVHIWCYKNGTELFTNEDGGASIKDMLYDGAQWMAAVIPPNPQDQNESAQPAPIVPEGFSREDLEAVADGLDGYEKTVNVGNVTGGGDDHLESTTAYAARFIRAMFAAPETKP